MNDARRPYSYDDIFPERWLHAPDLDGKAVTLTITAAYAEFIENPKKHKKDYPGEPCGVLSFKGTKREYVLSKQNAWILKALWGKDPAAYVGKRITLAPVPDSSGFTEHGTRILFTGSPDIEHDLSLNLPGGKHITFKRTAAGKQTVPEASVDPVTGEVDEPSVDPQPGLESTHEPEPESDPEPQLEGSDDDVPGRGPLNQPTPIRPAAATKPQLAEIVKLKKSTGIYEAEWVGLLDEFGATEADQLLADQADAVVERLRDRLS